LKITERCSGKRYDPITTNKITKEGSINEKIKTFIGELNNVIYDLINVYMIG
jgi:hypothetical protein